MTASSIRVQDNSSLYSRGRELYLTQIYYSVFGQSEQGLPRCLLLNVLLTGCFFLSTEDVLSLSWETWRKLFAGTLHPRGQSSQWMRNEYGNSSDMWPSSYTLTNSWVFYHDYYRLAVLVKQSISHLLVGNEGLAYLFFYCLVSLN